METLGHSSRKPEEESTVETLKLKDDDDDIDGGSHIICNMGQEKTFEVFV